MYIDPIILKKWSEGEDREVSRDESMEDHVTREAIYVSNGHPVAICELPKAAPAPQITSPVHLIKLCLPRGPGIYVTYPDLSFPRPSLSGVNINVYIIDLVKAISSRNIFSI